MKGLIVAAGYGTRFLPVTKTVPKELLPLVDRPALDYILDEFQASGIREILLVTSRRKRSLEDYLDIEVELEGYFERNAKEVLQRKIRPRDLSVAFVRQAAMLGTGHALLAARPWVGREPVVVAYPDDIHRGEPPLALQLIREYERTGDCVLAVVEDPPGLERYGVVRWSGQDNRVSDIVEKPQPGEEPSRSATIGRYLYIPEFFDFLAEDYAGHPGGEFYHVGALKRLMAMGRVRAIRVLGRRWDTGEPAGYLEAFLESALERPDLHQEALRLIKDLYARYHRSSSE